MNKEKTNKITDISERISEILAYTGDTRNSFGVKLGYERAQTVYDILNSKSAPSYDFFKKFQLSEFSDIIEIDWLLTGRGSMLKEEQSKVPVATVPAISDSGEASAYYKMYEKKDEENKALIEQIGQLKERLRQLEGGSVEEVHNKKGSTQSAKIPKAGAVGLESALFARRE